MSEAFEIAGSGMVTLQRALDLRAANVTNLNTQGYKRSEVSFSEVVGQAGLGLDGSGARADVSVAGVRVDPRSMVLEQGELQSTGRSMDIAIDGSGFLELVGPNGELYLWRGGTLSVGRDGLLAGPNGMALRDAISLPLSSTGIEIGPEGQVIAIGPDGASGEIGQIRLVLPENADSIERQGGGLYAVSDGSLVRSGQAGEDGFGRLVQGATERSNVDLNTEMIEMMILQRSYAANAQVVQAADQLLSIANNLRR